MHLWSCSLKLDSPLLFSWALSHWVGWPWSRGRWPGLSSTAVLWWFYGLNQGLVPCKICAQNSLIQYVKSVQNWLLINRAEIILTSWKMYYQFLKFLKTGRVQAVWKFVAWPWSTGFLFMLRQMAVPNMNQLHEILWHYCWAQGGQMIRLTALTTTAHFGLREVKVKMYLKVLSAWC